MEASTGGLAAKGSSFNPSCSRNLPSLLCLIDLSLLKLPLTLVTGAAQSGLFLSAASWVTRGLVCAHPIFLAGLSTP